MSLPAAARHCPVSLPDLLACRARRCCRRLAACEPAKTQAAAEACQGVQLPATAQ